MADVADQRIRKINTSGVITTVAGTGVEGFSGDGEPAASATLNHPIDVAFDGAGNLHIAEWLNYRIRRVDTNGFIATVAGTGAALHGGDGGPATAAGFSRPESIIIDHDGNILVADAEAHRIRKIAPADGAAVLGTNDEIVFLEPGGTGHVFSPAGQHLGTMDRDTGATLRTFAYNEAGRLIAITDRFGNETTVEYTAEIPTAIVSPDNLRTTLAIDENNQLTKVAYPDFTSYSFTYSAEEGKEGLMTFEEEPKGNKFEHVYDHNGRITDVKDQEGGHWNNTKGDRQNMLDVAGILIW